MGKYVDVSAITQIIGCVFNDVSILDNTDQYIIHEEDFVEDFHKIVFGSIYNIHLSNSEVSINAIVDYLANRPKFEKIFEKNRGVEYLMEASKNAQPATFNYYYNRMKKFSLLRAYHNFGLDVSFLYDPNEVIDLKKRQKQEDWLDNTPIVEIANIIDKSIDEIRGKYIEDDLGLGYQAGDNIIELIEDLEQNPEIGIPLYGELINTVTRGARLRKFYLRSAPSGIGKAIPDNTFIPTPDGLRQVKDIAVGDMLFDKQGQPTKVTGVFPQGAKKVWKVELADGRVAECCKDHLWNYCYENSDYKTESLEQIYKKFIESPQKKIYIPLCNMVKYPEKEHSIHPYFFGYLLANFTQPFNYIPRAYLESSSTQRLQLLQGLIDANGLITKNGNKIQCTVNSSKIKDDLLELCYSLGMTAFGTKIGHTFDITIFTRAAGKIEITNIYETEKETNMTCFMVDNQDHLFLMNDYIVTHNTRTLIADACNFACNRIYNENWGWIKNGASHPTLFIATEQDRSEIQTMMLAFLSNVNEEHILDGLYINDERERVIEAAHILKDSPLWVEELPDFSLQDVENKIKKNIREHNIKYVLSVNEGLCNTFPVATGVA